MVESSRSAPEREVVCRGNGAPSRRRAAVGFRLCGSRCGLASPVQVIWPSRRWQNRRMPSCSSIYAALDRDQLDEALKLTDQLIAQHPNFRLAYLIRGDLLLAHAAPLTGIGNVTGGSPERLEELREEAFLRLKSLPGSASAQFGAALSARTAARRENRRHHRHPALEALCLRERGWPSAVRR